MQPPQKTCCHETLHKMSISPRKGPTQPCCLGSPKLLLTTNLQHPSSHLHLQRSGMNVQTVQHIVPDRQTIRRQAWQCSDKDNSTQQLELHCIRRDHVVCATAATPNACSADNVPARTNRCRHHLAAVGRTCRHVGTVPGTFGISDLGSVSTILQVPRLEDARLIVRIARTVRAPDDIRLERLGCFVAPDMQLRESPGRQRDLELLHLVHVDRN